MSLSPALPHTFTSGAVEFAPPPMVASGAAAASGAISPQRLADTRHDAVLGAPPILRTEGRMVSPERGDDNMDVKHRLAALVQRNLEEQQVYETYRAQRRAEREALRTETVTALAGVEQQVNIFDTQSLSQTVAGVLEPVMEAARRNGPPLFGCAAGVSPYAATEVPVPMLTTVAPPPPPFAVGSMSAPVPQPGGVPEDILAQVRRLEQERDAARSHAVVLQQRVDTANTMLAGLSSEVQSGRRLSPRGLSPAVTPAPAGGAVSPVPEVGHLMSRLDAINAESTAEIQAAAAESAELKARIEALQQEKATLLAAQHELRRTLESRVAPPLYAATAYPPPAALGGVPTLGTLRNQVQSLLATHLEPGGWQGGSAPPPGGPSA